MGSTLPASFRPTPLDSTGVCSRSCFGSRTHGSPTRGSHLWDISTRTLGSTLAHLLASCAVLRPRWSDGAIDRESSGIRAPISPGMGIRAPISPGMGIRAPISPGMGIRAPMCLGPGMGIRAPMGLGPGMGIRAPMGLRWGSESLRTRSGSIRVLQSGTDPSACGRVGQIHLRRNSTGKGLVPQ